VADTLITRGSALVHLGRSYEGLGTIRAGIALADELGLVSTGLRGRLNPGGPTKGPRGSDQRAPARPGPCRPEVSILTGLAMFNTLPGRQALFEQTMGAMRDALPEPMFQFLSANGSEWDTPVIGGPMVRPGIPAGGWPVFRVGGH